MPIKTEKDDDGCYKQYGNQKKYYYKCGDKQDEQRAEEKARKQGAAIKLSEMRGGNE